MEMNRGQSPFEDLDKGEVSVALASPFMLRFRGMVQARIAEVERQLLTDAAMACVNILDDDAKVGRQTRSHGASLAELRRIHDIIIKGESYARG